MIKVRVAKLCIHVHELSRKCVFYIFIQRLIVVCVCVCVCMCACVCVCVCVNSPGPELGLVSKDEGDVADSGRERGGAERTAQPAGAAGLHQPAGADPVTAADGAQGTGVWTALRVIIIINSS